MVSLTKEIEIGLYKQLALNRIFEEKTVELYRLEGIPELPHSNLGEEAIGVGSCYGLNQDDYVIPDLRVRPALITKGVPLKEICADMYGRLGGTTNGATVDTWAYVLTARNDTLVEGRAMMHLYVDVE